MLICIVIINVITWGTWACCWLLLPHAFIVIHDTFFEKEKIYFLSEKGLHTKFIVFWEAFIEHVCMLTDECNVNRSHAISFPVLIIVLQYCLCLRFYCFFFFYLFFVLVFFWGYFLYFFLLYLGSNNV